MVFKTIVMKVSKPVFVAMGILSIVLGIIGIIGSGGDYTHPSIYLFIGMGMAVLFWILSVVYILKDKELNSKQRTFWLIVVFSIPVISGLLYCITSQEKSKIMT